MLSNIGKPVNETGKLLHVANDIPEQTISDYEPTQALIAFFETPLSKAYKMGGV